VMERVTGQKKVERLICTAFAQGSERITCFAFHLKGLGKG